jgi:hypothetical protein
MGSLKLSNFSISFLFVRDGVAFSQKDFRRQISSNIQVHHLDAQEWKQNSIKFVLFQKGERANVRFFFGEHFF